MTVGEKIRQARERLGMTQTELANLTGIPQTSLSAVELGRQTSSENMSRIADVLRLKRDELQSGLSVPVWLESRAIAPQGCGDGSYLLRAKIPAFLRRKGALKIDTGITVQIPQGYCAFLSCDEPPGRIVGTGFVEGGKKQKIIIYLLNFTDSTFVIRAGEPIGKMWIVPLPEIDFTVEGT